MKEIKLIFSLLSTAVNKRQPLDVFCGWFLNNLSVAVFSTVMSKNEFFMRITVEQNFCSYFFRTILRKALNEKGTQI